MASGYVDTLVSQPPPSDITSYSPSLQEWGTNSPWPALPEYVPDLISRNLALRTYEKMRRNDGQIRAVLRAIKTPALAALYYVEPGEDTRMGHEIAEFVEYNLFENLRATWPRTLEEILYMIDFGFSVMEIVWEQGQWSPLGKGRRTRPFIMLKKLAPRPQTTIYRFYYDEYGDLWWIEHWRIDPQTAAAELPLVQIPADKAMVFTFDQHGGDLQGQSILRTAYKHWYYKDNFYKIDSIQKERHGLGVPKGKLPIGYTPQDKANAIQLLSNVRTNEKGYILEPPGDWNFEFMQVPGNLVNALESAEHHDKMIAQTILAQFLNAVSAGSSAGGSRAASAVMFDLFLKSLKHVVNGIVAQFNKDLIPRLVDYNYPNVSNYPHLCVQKIGDTRDAQQIAAALGNLASNGLITPDLDTENSIRESLDLPERHLSSPVNTIPNQTTDANNPALTQGADTQPPPAESNPQLSQEGPGGSDPTTGNVPLGSNVS